MSAPHPFDLYLAGGVSAPVAVARLLLAGEAPEAVIDAAQARRTGTARWRALEALVGRAELLSRTAEAIGSSGFDHADVGADAHEAVATIARAFDRLVEVSPELSVAAYSLGDPALLAAATAELVDWLLAERLVEARSRVLDLGCGIGRMETALADRCGEVVGVDVSPAMIAQAHSRCAAANVRFRLTDGRDLAAFRDGAFDLVLAVDSFPYLVQAGGGIAARHVSEAARVLEPGGALVVLNLSYRTPQEDIADACAWAQSAGLEVRTLAARPFSIWDGAAFVFDRC